ncbi:MAG: proton-conducting transporter membrane subunit [Ilumatobacteraceae bacterium]
MILAFGTVSQLGSSSCCSSTGTPETTYAGLAMLLAHVAFKATLFCTVGIVDHETHTRDIRRLTGLWRTLPWTAVAAGVAWPRWPRCRRCWGSWPRSRRSRPSSTPMPGRGAIAAAAFVLGAFLTVAYTGRFWWGTFAGPAVAEPASAHGRPGPGLLALPLALTAATVLGGVLAGRVGARVSTAAESLDGEAEGKLLLWHGITPALGVSVASLIVGGVIAWFTTPGRAGSATRSLGTSAAVRPSVRAFDSV